MQKVNVYNLEGTVLRELELDSNVFGVEVNNSLVHQVVVAQRANARQVLAHAKDRSEVRGGGKKPWRQKGTGRARHGSSRSPIWIGGGVTFGPTKDRNFSKKINKKMKKKALFMALSEVVKNENLVVVDELTVDSAKTKDMLSILSALPIKKKVLIVTAGVDVNLAQAVSNLPHIRLINAQSLNIVEVLHADTLITTVNAVEEISNHFLAQAKSEDVVSA